MQHFRELFLRLIMQKAVKQHNPVALFLTPVAITWLKSKGNNYRKIQSS